MNENASPTRARTRAHRPPSQSTDTSLQREEALTIFERGAPGRRAFQCPELDVPEVPIDELLPAHRRRSEPPHLPEVSEPEIVRHYVRLSKRNFDLDSGFYPLGSCTMKHNPRLHERVAALPGHARLHPLQDPERAQGALELMWSLERSLAEISGLPHVCLQPSAGSHGELAGVLLTRAYHEARGEGGRVPKKVLTPDTAHGTNPATVTMAGFQVVKVGTNPDGGVDLDDLRAKADSDVACLMLTNPNTLGLFDPNIQEIARVVHEVGATLYYDGANLNAVMGLSRPGDMGFDIVHFNLHKSFTQPHGGGGPGSGPIAVSERIEPFLPVPRVARGEDGSFDLVGDGSESIGRLRGFQGNYGCFVRSYAYICSLGAPGLKDASETAVLNANYLLARLRELGVLEHLPLAYSNAQSNPSSPSGDSQALTNVPSPSGDGKDGGGVLGLCLHEFVLSGGPMKRELKIKTLDLAKRLLDYGYHPPTVYFPLLVDEALMVEPTETETKETLDGFAEALAEILREAAEDPEIALHAPYTTPVRRLDEVGAAKHPVIRQSL
jgi:glycine dehydrogenase subunit 2